MAKRQSAGGIKARHDERRKKRIKEQKMRRIAFFSFLALVAVLIVMFFTPLFNIKNVVISGNNRISEEEIVNTVGEIEGKNLFSYRKGKIKNRLYKISYVEKVSVKKKTFPPTISIDIKECIPAFQAEYAGGFTVVDKSGKVLEQTAERIEGVPTMLGVLITSAKEGDAVAFKDAESQKIIMSCVENMEKAGIMADITVMSFEDMTNITFNYQNRLDVICGTHIDFQRKLALFKEAVNSNKLTENSRGTINLSTTGKAIYTP
jgi:hypothetical protein